jgi:hypothetical protein
MTGAFGIALWIASGTAALLLARAVPRRRRSLRLEAGAALAAALILGTLATALDFGGWAEPDWRAALFVLFGTLAVTGLLRLLGVESRP